MNKALTQLFSHLRLQPKESSAEEKFQFLANYLDHLVTNDFSRLLHILYRVDVSEKKAKRALANKNVDESNGEILAKLLLERESEKIKWRDYYKNNSL